MASAISTRFERCGCGIELNLVFSWIRAVGRDSGWHPRIQHVPIIAAISRGKPIKISMKARAIQFFLDLLNCSTFSLWSSCIAILTSRHFYLAILLESNYLQMLVSLSRISLIRWTSYHEIFISQSLHLITSTSWRFHV
jgi:hypothetical protein